MFTVLAKEFRRNVMVVAHSMQAREFNRRLKASLAALRVAGAKRVAVKISPDGSTLVYEMLDSSDEDEADRVGRLIEGKPGG